MLHTLLFILLFSLDEIILDIYNQLVELSSTDYEQLQNDLYALHQTPIQLNATSEEELQQLYFLSPRQIDNLLAYADAHPFESLYELRLIPSLTDFDIRKVHNTFRRGQYDRLSEELRKCMLCGKCTLVCPRGVNLRSLIINMRQLLPPSNESF